ELQFYRSDNGIIATGRTDTNGIFTQLADGQLSDGWSHINALGRELQFYRSDNGIIATGRTDTNGIFTQLADGQLSTGWEIITGVA
ncbi:hypothetical protein ACF09C_07285, partial [Streptomyces sp. NPDC014870]|uniref:hypothetical protein n=1 Tax=Streptomyces sp. NPDC014870 TaxID=3364925 RepID=UPI0036F6B8D3